MPKVSVNILTKNRAALLRQALDSIRHQQFTDFEIVVVNDASTDETSAVLAEYKNQGLPLICLHHARPAGITVSRQEALIASSGQYIAILDDDDRWVDPTKLRQQVDYFDAHPKVVLAGGGMEASNLHGHLVKYFRPVTDRAIRRTMLLRNNFFTSTVMFRRIAALQAGGFLKDEQDLAEDYDLWLRLGRFGELYNFQSVFVNYRRSAYNKERFRAFLRKQLKLVGLYKHNYPGYIWGKIFLTARLLIAK